MQVCYIALALCMLLNTVTVANFVKYSVINCIKHSVEYSAINCRKHSALLTDFNAKGDGKTLNTGAFEAAITHLSKLAEDGGAQLIVPPGKYLTGTINLISSHFTLFLHQHAEIITSTVLSSPCISLFYECYLLLNDSSRVSSITNRYIDFRCVQ